MKNWTANKSLSLSVLVFFIFSRASTMYGCLTAGVFLVCTAGWCFAGTAEFHSNFLSLGLSNKATAFSVFSVDSLGQGKLTNNQVLKDDKAIAGLQLDGQTYKLDGQAVWRVTWSERELTLQSDFVKGVEMPPFTLAFDQKLNHATLLGRMEPEGQQMNLPCVLHLPDMGSLRITGQGKIDYSASREAKPEFVRVAFLPATAQQPHVEYKLEAASLR